MVTGWLKNRTEQLRTCGFVEMPQKRYLISDSNKDVTCYLLFDEALALGLAVGQSLTIVFEICDNALDAVDVDLTQVLLYAVQHRLQTPYMSA